MPLDFTVADPHTMRLVCITEDAYVSKTLEACNGVGLRSACAHGISHKCKAANQAEQRVPREALVSRL